MSTAKRWGKRVREATPAEEAALQEMVAGFEPVAVIRPAPVQGQEPPRLVTVLADLLAAATEGELPGRCGNCEVPVGEGVFCEPCAFVGPVWPHLRTRILIREELARDLDGEQEQEHEGP